MTNSIFSKTQIDTLISACIKECETINETTNWYNEEVEII